MWLPQDIIASVDALARIHYIDAQMCKTWNTYRRAGELRLLTGWCWSAADGRHRQGFKTKTVCYRDAYYTLVKRRRNTPGAGASAPLRIVA